MAGIIVSTPPTVQQPSGSSSGDSAVLPGVTYTYAVLSIPQTWTAKQTFPLGNISVQAGDVVGLTPSATTDTTNASNISSGTLAAARLPNPTASTLGGVESIAAVSHNWIASISTSGVPALSQPAFADISGSVAATQLPNPSASTLGGVQSAASVSHQWINSISTSGVPSLSQPAFSDISGSVAATQLPNPSASTLGGIQSAAAVSHQWINSISTSGVPALSQPAFSDISGNISTSQMASGTGASSSTFWRGDGTWIAPPSGTVVALETLTASNSATLQTAASWAGYSSIEFVFLNIVPATTLTTFEMQVHASAAYQNTAYINNGYLVTSSAATSVSSATTFVQLTNTSAQVNTSPGLSGYLRIYNPATAIIHHVGGSITFSQAGPGIFPWTVAALWNSATAIDGAQFLFSAGNITSGSIRVYGIA